MEFNDSIIYINPDLIEFLEETPDTVVTMTTGKKLIVKESIGEIQKVIVEYKRGVYLNPPKEIIRRD